ncbi:MAG: ribonuclease H-like domain-containing protein [Chthoniobacterales bacterium]|nr:ribonuclease H-like domain-containing protein [Chthoniobacterales bacterium]
MKNIVYFDLETQLTANDVGGWDRKADMKISLGVTYSTATETYEIFSEKRVPELIETLSKADLVVGYNNRRFDYEVLMGYTILDLAHHLPTLDLLEVVERAAGHRLSLDAIATATLGVGKTGDGLDAIRWWREGKLMEIARYCCFDVKVTKLVHEYAMNHGELHFIDRFSRKQTLQVSLT